MAALSTFSEPLPQTRSATISYPAGDAVVIVVNGALLSEGFGALDRLVVEALGDAGVAVGRMALSSGGLTLHGNVRAALSDAHL
jgi:hypothetical protein